MRTLWAASYNHLLHHPAQLALALLGLALGVATITAVDIATASAERAFELSMDAVNGAATHQITAGPAGIDEQLYVSLRMDAAPAIAPIEMAPIVEGYAVVADRAMQILGIDPLADIRVRGRDTAGVEAAGQGVRMGRWFTEPGTVFMAEETATQIGISVEETFQLEIGGRRHPAKLLAQLEGAGPGFEALILCDIAQAQEWLGSIGKLSRIDLHVPSGGAGDRALKHLRSILPAGMQLRAAPRRAQQSVEMTRAFTVNLQAMSLLALLVSVFLIYSAVSFSVIQRRRIFGVLRALGATRANVLTLVLMETLALALAGAALGILLGSLIGRQLIELVSRTINDLYFVVSVNQVILPWTTSAKAASAAVAVALVAAALPAIEAAGSAPQLGLRRSVLERRATQTSRALLIAGALCGMASAVVVLLSQRSLFAGFASLFLLLIAIAAFTPAMLRSLATLAGRMAGRFSSVARLAFGEIAASLSRTGVAVAALGMALAAMIGVSIMVESFRESLRDWLDRTLVADLYISAPGAGFARPERQLHPEVIQALLHVPGVADHSESRRSIVDSPRGRIIVDALRLTPQSHAAVELTQGNEAEVWPAFEAGAIVISEPLAWRLSLSLGDELILFTAHGPQGFSIAGICREYGNDQGAVLMSRKHYSRLWQDDAITALGLYLAPGEDAARMTQMLRAAVSNSVPARVQQALNIRPNAELRAVSMKVFERTFVITRVLYWLAAGVAAIGLISALLAWELERARELATLRSLGLTPLGTAALIESQTGFMGLAALLAAIPAGLFTAAILIDVINRRAFGWRIELHLSAAQFGNALVLALAASLLAGIYPAWRAARTSIASGMREE
jgi:putative ABC transport system permease protein